MALNRMKYTPSDGLKNSETFQATPASEEDAREQFQRLLDQIKEQVNALMAALENKSDEVSGAHQIGSGNVGQLVYNGAAARTIWTQLAALNQRIDDAISGGLSIGEIIKAGDIESSMLDTEAVTEDKLALDSVTETRIKDAAVTTNKLGIVSKLVLKNRSEQGPDKVDTLNYEGTTLTLKVVGCEDVVLAPVVFGKASTPSGNYPAGTIYIQYVD